jgi:hypothetical protein
MFVQGRTDASRKWGELVKDFVSTELGLSPIVPTLAPIWEYTRVNQLFSVVPPMTSFSSAVIRAPTML